MKYYTLLEKVSLPTNNEQKIIKLVNNLSSYYQKSDKNIAQLLSNRNSLILSNTDTEKEQLYAMLIKDYLLNKYNGRINGIVELEEIIRLMDIRNEKLAKQNIETLIDYLNSDEKTRFYLTLDFIINSNNINNRYNGIKKCDEDTCAMLCENLNYMIESKTNKNNTINNYDYKVYRRVSSK